MLARSCYDINLIIIRFFNKLTSGDVPKEKITYVILGDSKRAFLQQH